MISLNGGMDFLQAQGNQISFASSLISWLPLIELAVLSILLWRSGLNLPQEGLPEPIILPMEPQTNE
jgi:hypothetical protein